MRTLWDLIDPILGRLAAPAKPKPRVIAPAARPAPRRRTPPSPKPTEPADGSMQAKYDAVAKELLDHHRIRVRKWRKSMSGIAWYVLYRKGTRVNLIEAP